MENKELTGEPLEEKEVIEETLEETEDKEVQQGTAEEGQREPPQ